MNNKYNAIYKSYRKLPKHVPLPFTPEQVEFVNNICNTEYSYPKSGQFSKEEISSELDNLLNVE